MDDFLSFRRMITPVIIQIVFWVAVAVTLIVGLVAIITGDGVRGLLVIVLGPLVARIYCELLILLFRINDSLTDIRGLLSQSALPGTPLVAPPAPPPPPATDAPPPPPAQ